MQNSVSGGCACGQVRYRLRSSPLFVNCCHCKDCQRQTGSALVLNALIETDRVEILQGKTALFGMPTDSGRPHDVARCPDCGTAVWSNYGGLKVLTFLRVGTLDEPAVLPPDVHIHTGTKLPWVTLPSGTPAFDACYESKTLWPADSLVRRRAIFG